MLDVTFFENPRFTAANISIVLVFFALFGSLFFLTQYLQFVLGYSALEAGIRVAPLALVLMIGAPIAGRLTARFGNKVLVAAGMGIVAVGLWFMGTLTVTSGYWHVVIALVILGFGHGDGDGAATESIMGSLPLAKAGRRLGDERHHAADRRRARRRDPGQHLRLLVRRHTSRPRSPGCPRRPSPLRRARSARRSRSGEDRRRAGAAITAAAKTSFIDAMDRGLIVGATIALLGALVALIWLPNRAADADAIELHVPRMTASSPPSRSAPSDRATCRTDAAHRGRPRDPEADRAILEATIELLAERGSVACRSRPSQLAPVSARRPSTGVGRRRSRSWSTRSPI